MKELAELINKNGIERTIFNNELKPFQAYNLAKATGIEAVDRFQLILEIFARRASTTEAKLQIQLARLRYELARAKERVKLAKMGEQPGFMGLGAYKVDVYYETVKRQIHSIQDKLRRIRKKRRLHRARRLELGFPLSTLAGYTNAGKSIPHHELVLALTSSDSGLIPIGRIFQNHSKSEIYQHGAYEYIKASDIHVLCFNENLKLNWVKPTALIRHKAPSVLYKVVTGTGREALTTGHHSLFTFKNGVIVPTPVKDLKIGDRIAIPKRLPESQILVKEINIINYLKDRDYGLYIGNVKKLLNEALIRLGKKRTLEILGVKRVNWKKDVLVTRLFRFLELMQRANIHFNPAELWIACKTHRETMLPGVVPVTKELMRLLGYFTSEGGYDLNRVVFSNKDPRLQEDIINLCLKVFRLKPCQSSRQLRILFTSKPLRVLFEHILGLHGGSENKNVPSLIWQMPLSHIAEFLRGYFSGDAGESSIEGRMIEATTKSRCLAVELVYLLLFFGIVSSKRMKVVKESTYWRIFIHSNDLEKFVNYIGFIQEEKNSLIRKYINERRILSKRDTFSVKEIIPLLKELYKRDKRAGLMCAAYWRRKNIGRQRIHRLLRIFDREETCKGLRCLIDSDIFWDKISVIKKVKNEDTYVYDFDINPTQNFIGGTGGVFLHNSTLFNALAEEAVPVDPSLFTTISTTTRAVDVFGKKVLLTDTVGFIDRLPLTLIEAFHSTLEETIFSDLILLVVDVSEPHDDVGRKVNCCLDTIQKIGASGIPIITALNKIDLLSEGELQHEEELLKGVAPNRVPVSALYKTNIDLLKQGMAQHFRNYVQAMFSVPITDESMSFLSWLFSRADIRDIKYEGDSVKVVFESVPWFADKVKGRVEQFSGIFNT
ncbi:MAG: GTPase HflX [Candidatus Bathyarchaeota archaeon BA1]|nr:MAG: GTPase HflX [Candidatus Bathyarchaeota archaeon BA1]